MKRVVVTGGAGFIGSHLSETLLERGYQVIILDDLSTGRQENVDRLLSRYDAKFTLGSITDLDLLQKLFRGIDYVFHEAALPSVPRSIRNPRLVNDVNVSGTLNVLIAARDNGVRKVIYASSSSVYGDTPTLPKRESMPATPLSPYAVTKLAGEHYCQVFSLVYGLPTVCLRYFNVYGPNQPLDGEYAAVIPLFIRRALRNEPPEILGDGEQTRDFTYIGDAVSANLVAAESDAAGVFNVGGGRNVTINHLARLIIDMTGNRVEAVHVAPRPGDVRDSLADISRIGAFGYEPRYNLEEGLQATIGSMKHET